jgi:hypothetical protein
MFNGRRANFRPAWSQIIVAVLVGLSLFASGCNAEPAAATDFNQDAVFAPAPDAAQLVQRAGCGSNDAVDIYLKTIARRNNEFAFKLSAAEPDTRLEIRLSFAQPTSWHDAAPAPSTGLRIVGGATVVTSTFAFEVFERTSFASSDEAANELTDLLAKHAADRRERFEKANSRYQTAIDRGNEQAATRREGPLGAITARKVAADLALELARSSGPDVLVLSIAGSAVDLVGYLDQLADNPVRDAIIVEHGTASRLVRTEFESFDSVDQLQRLFTQSAMLSMPQQLRAMNAGYACPS